MARKKTSEDEERSLLLPLLGGAVVLLVVVVAAWCFFFRSSDADVRGLVTLDGTPVPGAVVVFVSEDTKKETTVTAVADADGNYRLVGNSGAGIPIGKYKVAVTKEALKGGKVLQGEELEQARAKGHLLNVMPTAYEDRKNTPLQFDITSGSNTINLELKKPAKMP